MSSRLNEWQHASETGGPGIGGWALMQPLRRMVMRVWAGVEARRKAHIRRSLRVVETVGMGEKRFVAIVEVQQERFLVGGGAAGVSLLARLGPEKDSTPSFAAFLDEQTGAHSSAESQLAMLNERKEAW